MNPTSPKRKAAIKNGTVRTAHNSTIKVGKPKPWTYMTVDELKASGLLKRASKLGKSSGERARAKASAWKWFSEFIRLRDSQSDGRGQCITCPRSGHWRTMDAGHFITRAKESTLFDERNVSLQCKGCNRFQGGKFFEHEQAIERKFGAGTAQAIKDKAGQECRRTTEDYRFLSDTYKTRVEWIKSHEPGKYFRDQ